MKKSKTIYIDMAVLSALGFVPLLWFRDGYGAIAGFDFSVYLNPVDTMTRSLYLWSDRMAGGYDVSHEISSLAYYIVFALPVLLGASLYTAEKFVFGLLFALQGVAMYYMLITFSGHGPGDYPGDYRLRRLASYAGAVLYAFSYPVMAHFGRGNLMAVLAYALLPVLLALLYRGFNDRTGHKKYILLIALLSLPISSTKGHPADFLVLFGVAASFTAFHAVTSDKAKALHTASFALKASLASLLVNLWWVLPNIRYLNDFGLDRGDLLKEGFYNLELLDYYSRGTSVLNVFRNERLDLWFDFPTDEVLNPAIYQTPLFIAVGIIIPVTAFSALLRKRIDRNTVFFSLLGVLSVFLAKGSHAPFGELFRALYLNVPGFFFFRAPYRIFSSLFTFSTVPLIALSLSSIAWRMSARRGDEDGSVSSEEGPSPFHLTQGTLLNLSLGLLIAFFILAAMLYAWPVFTGAHLKEKGSARVPGVFHNIPEEYFQADKWLKAQGEGFKVYYPYDVYDSNTVWGYNGPDPSFELLTAPKVAARPGGTVYIRYQKPIESLNRMVRDWRYGDLKKVIGLYNARYVLLHRDLSPWTLPDYNFNEYAESLFRKNGMDAKTAIGQLLFYENSAYSERVSYAKKGYILSGSEEALPALSLTRYLDDPFLVMARDLDGPGLLPGKGKEARTAATLKGDHEGKDAGKSGIHGLLASLDGAIFHDSNVTDLVCDLLLKETKPVTGSSETDYYAPEDGTYRVFRRAGDGMAKRPRDTAGRNGAGHDDISGFRWTEAARMELKMGANRIRPAKGARQRGEGGMEPGPLLIVPEEGFLALRREILERMKDPDFEVAYLLSPEKKRGRVFIDLPGDSIYSVKTHFPKRFRRKMTDAFFGKETGGKETGPDGRGKTQWAVSAGKGTEYARSEDTFTFSKGPGGGRALRVVFSKDTGGLDLARFPMLEMDKGRRVNGGAPRGDAGAVTALQADLYLGFDEKTVKMTLRDSDLGRPGASVDVHDLAVKRFGPGMDISLKRIEFAVTIKEPGPVETDRPGHLTYSIRAPKLLGSSAVEDAPCFGGDRKALTIADARVAARRASGGPARLQGYSGGAQCGRWVSHDGKRISPGRYALRFDETDPRSPGSGPPPPRAITLIEKETVGKERASTGAVVKYRRINPTRYEVELKGGRGGNIVFNDSFNAGWTLRGKKGTLSPVKVNGYANGFILDGGEEKLVLEYSPQKIYSLSRVISVAALSGLAAVALNASVRA